MYPLPLLRKPVRRLQQTAVSCGQILFSHLFLQK
jgi:hypothetical protein